MESLKIKVTVANRTYPLTIKREDEEQVRKAVKVIEERLKVYEKSFGMWEESHCGQGSQ